MTMISRLFLLILLGISGAASVAAGQTNATLNVSELLDRAIEDEDGDFPGWVREIVLDSSGAVERVVVELSGSSRRSIVGVVFAATS